jgi:3-dehydroquinate dehydratase/shikimate dehydrogenase
METPKICLTLTGTTLDEDLKILEKYRRFVDLAELRVDFLNQDERLYVRRFPSLAGIPCILTIRRAIDGGKFIEGESARTVLFARALSFADEDRSKNFAYVDFEEDFHIASLEDATLAFDTKIIRSVHEMKNSVGNILERMKKMTVFGFEIPKIAFMPKDLDDVTNLFSEATKLKDNNHILIAMGPMGVATRILGARLKNFLTYTSAPDSRLNKEISHVDAVTLNDVYRIREINDNTKIFGITGWPLAGTSSPLLHNGGYKRQKMNSIYIPVPAPKFSQALSFAEQLGVQGFSVTVPHKEDALKNADFVDKVAEKIGSSNTLVRQEGRWCAYNTDAEGFGMALLEFTGLKNLKHKKISIIGAGGAAMGVAYAVSCLGGKACVFNRTFSRAKELADKYKFKAYHLGIETLDVLKNHSDIIIQTTSKGMHSTEPSNAENDPIYFYDFSGKEILFDIVYMPSETPVMIRARNAGCQVSNGYSMLLYQGYKQFELFTGVEYE